MIKRIDNEAELAFLPEKGIEANKIRALFLAYGLKYDFCRFYIQDDECIISSLDGSFVICGDSPDYEELAKFFTVNGFSDIFCSEEAGLCLTEYLPSDKHRVNFMKYSGDPYPCAVDEAPSLTDVYAILKDCFDIDFEPWYLDMSHRVRHGVSQCFLLNETSTVTVQYDINGEALISQVATKKDSRGQGTGSRIVKAVSSKLSPSEVYIICEDELIDFYKRSGYTKIGKKCIILPKSY